MWLRAGICSLFAFASVICAASAQDMPFDNGFTQATERARALRDVYVARGAEVIDHGMLDDAVSVHNRGAEAVFVVACEDHCTQLGLVLEAEGLSRVRARPDGDNPRVLEFRVPANFVASRSDWRVRFNVRCSGADDSCDSEWYLLALSPAPPLELRGGPQALTDAEWEAGVDLPEGVRLRWLQQPTLAQSMAFYPPGALRRNEEGTAVLACVVGDGGAVRCRPESETPVGSGFAEAAMRLSPLMRASLNDSAGQPAIGRRTRITLRFALG